MPDKRTAPMFLELGERLETADGRKVLKAFLLWLANSKDDATYSKSALLQQLVYLAGARLEAQVNSGAEPNAAGTETGNGKAAAGPAAPVGAA